MSNYSYVNHTADGNTNTFVVPFSYTLQKHVKIYIDSVLYATGADTTKVTWLTTGTIKLASTPVNGAKVKIKRETQLSGRLVDFQNNGLIDESTLDEDSNQLFYLVQEAYDNSSVLQADDAASKAASSAALAKEYAAEVKASAYGYLTNTTTSSTVGFWFKLFTVTLRQLNDNINGKLSLLEGVTASTDPAKTELWFHVTQSSAMGNAPTCKLHLVGIENNWITASRIKAVVLTNTVSTTEVAFYVCISKNNTDVGYAPTHIHWPYSSDVSIAWSDSDKGTASLPSGTQFSCETMDATFRSLNYPPGFYSGLVIKATSNASVVLTAKGLSLGDSTGQSVYVSGVSLTIRTDSTGTNGLDKDTVTASTWYSVWVIYNLTTAATAGLLSTSETSPTLPDGYTFYYRFGWVRTADSSTSLKYTKQTGNRAEYVIDGTVLTQHPIIAYGSTNSTSKEYSMSSYVPVSTAGSVLLSLVKTASGGTIWVAPSSEYSIKSQLTSYEQHSAPATTKNSIEMFLESSNIYYASDNSTNYLVCRGWVDNI